MEIETAVACLGALSHPGRLQVFRMLVQAGLTGMAAGDISRRQGVPPNSLSANLSILAHAGLVRSRRQGRSIVYTAEFDRMSELLGFLVEDCCDGSPEICWPLAAIVRTCAPKIGKAASERAAS